MRREILMCSFRLILAALMLVGLPGLAADGPGEAAAPRALLGPHLCC